MDQLCAPDKPNPSQVTTSDSNVASNPSVTQQLLRAGDQQGCDDWLHCVPEAAYEDSSSQHFLAPCTLCFDHVLGLPVLDEEIQPQLQAFKPNETTASAAPSTMTIQALTDLTNRIQAAVPAGDVRQKRKRRRR